jgi:hypothetical protein
LLVAGGISECFFTTAIGNLPPGKSLMVADGIAKAVPGWANIKVNPIYITIGA